MIYSTLTTNQRNLFGTCLDLKDNHYRPQTGQNYNTELDETLSQFSQRINVPIERLTFLNKIPNPNCKKCKGTGSNKKGTKKNRKYFPCFCTQ